MHRDTWISLGVGALVAGLCGALVPSWGPVGVGFGVFIGLVASLACAALLTERARRG